MRPGVQAGRTLGSVSTEARLNPPLTARLRAAAIRDDPSLALLAAGVLSAVMVGVALAMDLPAGVALLIAVCYVPLVLVNLQLGVALWVPLLFLQGIPAFNLASDAAGLLIIVAWVGNLRARREAVISVVHRHRRLLAALVGLGLWLTLSLAWADDPGLTGNDLWRWYALGVLFVVFATTFTEPATVRVVAYAFVGGAALSVVAGIFDGSLTSAVSGAARAEGGAGDPNFLAASVVAATVMALGLLAAARSAALRFLLLAAMAILVVGLVGSASRGGNLAAGVAILTALVIFKRRRAHVLAGAAVVVGIAVLSFANAPATWERVTNFDDDNGRSDLWYVAWEMGKDSPVGGVGLSNFVLHSSDYVQTPGGIDAVRNIVEKPHFAHNTYLQLFAENGIVGLVLFLVVVTGSLGACKRAADRFDLQGEDSLTTLARAVFVAAVSILAAATFLSAGLDLRLWLLLGLGPALLAIAVGADEPEAAAARPAQDRRDRWTQLVPRLDSGA